MLQCPGPTDNGGESPAGGAFPPVAGEKVVAAKRADARRMNGLGTETGPRQGICIGVPQIEEVFGRMRTGVGTRAISP